MRDRLEELHQTAQESSGPTAGPTNPFSEEGDDDESVEAGTITQQAVVFEEEPVIQNFLSEAQQIRDDISTLETEVRWEKNDKLKYSYLVNSASSFHTFLLEVKGL